jgi:ABC-type glycerol-3-phosphate transport system substrate-binding protein
MQPAPTTWDETIAVGDTVRAFGNATGRVTAITLREGMTPLLTYEALHDVPALKVKQGQEVNCDIARCRKVV